MPETTPTSILAPFPMANPAQAPPSHFKSALLVAPMMVVSPLRMLPQAPRSIALYHQAAFQSWGWDPATSAAPRGGGVLDGLPTTLPP